MAMKEQQRALQMANPLRFYRSYNCLLYTSDAADERSSVDLGGRRIIKKKTNNTIVSRPTASTPHRTHTHVAPTN